MEELQKIIERLNEFKYDQVDCWREVKEISDEPMDDEQLPTIVENDEDCTSELQLQTETVLQLITQLREGEIKIVERYKQELKSLAMELKEISQKENKNKFTQTESPNFEYMYLQEKSKFQQIEKKIDSLKKFDDTHFKQEVQIELTSLKNKIQILTEASAEAETMLIKKDNQVKDLTKQVQYLQKELTSKRGELSIIQDKLKQNDANLKMIQSLNKNYEMELNKRDQQKPPKPLEISSVSQNNQTRSRPSSSSCYKSLALEIQELTLENSQLKQQLSQCNKKLKEVQGFTHNERQQLEMAHQQIEELTIKLEQNPDLNEAMEYLEMKDLEIEKLRRELDMTRRGTRDSQQVKDLQNLLMIMSRTLQEKELLIQQLQN
ncbi:hypothetical protein pb186bvf_004949 [Paramecium bursaria]